MDRLCRLGRGDVHGQRPALQRAQLGQYQRRASAPLAPGELGLLTNPRFPRLPLSHTRGSVLRRTCFDQLDFTCGDWSDQWYHALYYSYTRMRAPTSTTAGALRPRVKAAMATLRPLYFGTNSPYVSLSPATTQATLTYVFQHLQKGIYVRIRGGTLDAFLPFCRHNFTNTVYDQYYLPGSPDDRAQLREMRQLEAALRAFDADHRDPETATPTEKAQYTKQLGRLLALEATCARRYARAHRARHSTDVKANPNRRQWLPNNHFVNQAVYLDNPNVHHFRYLLTTLVAHRSLPDAEFVLNLRDHPVLRADHDTRTGATTVSSLSDVESDATAVETNRPPSCSQCPADSRPSCRTRQGQMPGIALPTVDDIQHYSQRVFMDQCTTHYIDATEPEGEGKGKGARPPPLWVEWADKTVAKAVFRGSGTGRGTTPEVNQRMAVWRLAHTPKGRAVLDVELTSLNAKPKVVAGDDGLAFVQQKAVETACGSTAHKSRHYLDLAARSTHRCVLCLDGQTRADRMLNEMRIGVAAGAAYAAAPARRSPAVARGLPRRSIGSATCGTRRQVRGPWRVPGTGGYTHVTIDDVTEVDALVRWLVAHDAAAKQVVANVKTTLFHPVHGLGARRPPATCFLYDYMEAVVRLIAQRHAHSARRPYTLVPAPVCPPTATQSVVGIVVGFRDTVPGGGARSAQLDAFRAYFATLFPSAWAYDLVVETQPEVPGDRAAFDAWWASVFDADRTTASVGELRDALRTHGERGQLPTCLTRNLALVNGTIDLALAVPDTRSAKRAPWLRRVWTRAEAYRRIGEEKFNLGRCKNRGYRRLKAKHGPRLSHVVFTDIDILPDHTLAPWYVRVPQSHEVIALAHRGTVYETVTVDDLPVRDLDGPGHRPTNRSQRHRRTHGHTHTHTHKHTHLPTQRARGFRTHHRRGQWPRRRRGGDNAGRAQRQSTRASTGLVRRAEEQAKQWTQRKYKRFLGAALSIHPTLFEAANGYPNSFWGWGGEDDALVDRLGRLSAAVTYTVPPVGRLIDREMAEPVTLGDNRNTGQGAPEARAAAGGRAPVADRRGGTGRALTVALHCGLAFNSEGAQESVFVRGRCAGSTALRT